MHASRVLTITIRSGGRRSVLVPPVLVVGMVMLASVDAIAQNGNGSTGAAFGGAALGAVSGSMLALSGGLGGCNRTLRPSRCSRITTTTGAVIGLTAGAVIGWQNSSNLENRFKTAAFGTAVGAAGGIALKLGIQHFGWPDVAATSIVGLAFGAAVKGASIGFAAGAATGLLLWRFHPSVGPGGAVAWGLAGMGMGGLVDWVAGAVEGDPDTSAIPIQFSFVW